MTTTGGTVESLSELADVAAETPVICDINRLEARVLQTCYDISVCSDIETFWQIFESPTQSFDRDVVIDDVTNTPGIKRELTTYTPPATLPVVDHTGDVYDRSLNTYTSHGALSWTDVADTTLCQSDISNQVTDMAGSYDAVALVIVDGLSYVDWTSHGGDAQPVYVDCPTITECGYPNVVAPPDQAYSIATQLHERGIRYKRAYTYWEKQHNELTERLHDPFSPNEVNGDIESFNDVARDLRRRPVSNPAYIQITLTGPERVAHRIKEDPYIDNQVQQVRDKLAELDDLLTEQADSHLILATADHGILWRMTTDFTVLDGEDFSPNDRRHLSGEATDRSLPADRGIKDRYDGTEYFRLLHPYLFHDTRSNEPGVHGGYSCEECIVPLISIEG